MLGFGGVALLLTVVGVPAWLDPRAGAAFEAWAVEMCERNDHIDAEARILFPASRVTYDPEFAAKTERLLDSKRALLAKVQAYEIAPWQRGVHGILVLALRNSIRHHEARQAQHAYTEARLTALQRSGRVDPEDLSAAWIIIAQGYPDPDNGLRMGIMYQRQYDDLHERLGLPPMGVWPSSTRP